jgi:hypothetical protein
MPASLNLAPARGPSVWARMDRDAKTDRRWLAMIVGGAVLAASARRRSSIGRAWALALGLTFMAAGFFGHGYWRRLSAALERLRGSGGGPVNDAIDRASTDSFPASDAPSSSTTVFAPRT